MRRKFFSILTALALCLSLCPAWAFAAEGDPEGTQANPWLCGAEGDNLKAVLYGTTLTISGTGAMADYATSIDTPWYDKNNKIQRVVLSENVTTIGDNAFSGVSALSNVTIPGAVTRIGKDAFCYAGLTGLTLPEGVTAIGNGAFSYNNNLSNVTIPASVTEIGSSAFNGSFTLNTVIFQGRKAPTVGKNAFKSSADFKTVSVPHGCKAAYQTALANSGIPNLKSIITAPAEHEWNDDGSCVCGAQAVAKIDKVGLGPSFAATADDLDAALADKNNEGAVFTLLKDVTYEEREQGLEIKITCTLDLNGHTIHSTGEYASALSTYGGTNVTIQDQSQDHRGQVISDQSQALAVNGSVTLEGGTFTSNGGESAGVYVNSASASLSVAGEYVTIRNTGGGYGLAVNTTQSVRLSAGTYEGGAAAIAVVYGGSKTLADVLDSGYAIFNEDGTGVDRTLTTTGPGTFTVKTCDHTGITYTQDEGGATHTGTCPLCGDIFTRPCEYGDYEYDETNHWKTCSVCDGKLTAAHDAASLNAAASGTAVTVKEGCATCGYGEELGKAVFTFENLVYENPDAKVSWTKTGSEQLGVEVKVDDAQEWTAPIFEGAGSYPLTELSAGEHTLWVVFLYDTEAAEESGGFLNECELPFTVKRAIPKGDPTYTAISESGKTLADAALTAPESWPGGVLSWNLPEDTAVTANAKYEWTFTPADGTNYEGLEGAIILWKKSSGGGGGGGIVTPPVDPDPGPDEPDPPVDPDKPDPPVDPDEPLVPDGTKTKLEVTEGITEVPPALAALEHLNTPQKLAQAMRTAVTQTGVPEEDTAVYDVELQISTDGGQTWTPATKENFPTGGLVVTLPYPAGTDSSYTFTVVHMFTTSAFGKTPGDTETPPVTNTEDGLRFTVTGLSPISVGWKAAEKPVEPEKPVTPSRPSGGGGGVSSYRVTVEKSEHGKVSSNRAWASRGGSVTLTATPDSGYILDTLAVTDSRGNTVKLTDQGDGKYTFPMPARAVTVKAEFRAVRDAWSNPYSDVSEAAWYCEAVRFVTENGLMSGYETGLFGPDDALTRAQFVRILHNREGNPVVNYLMGFEDVPGGAWYAEAVRWAASRGIVSGCEDGTFAPDAPITREQLAVILWRYAGRPAAGGTLSFADADQAGGYALEALRWAVEQGIISGYSNRLGPKTPATRGQVAQILRNFLQKQ